MIPKTNQQKYPNESNWQQFAACRKMDPNLFCSWESKDHAIKICQKCVVAKRCREEPSKARAAQNISLIGIWGGMWEPLDLPRTKTKTRLLHERMVHEADDQGIYSGVLSQIPPIDGSDAKATYLTAIQLKDTGVIEATNDSKTKWKVNALSPDISDLWRYLVNTADINGDIVLNVSTTVESVGYRSEYQMYRNLSALREMNVLFHEGHGLYRINLEAIGA